MKFDFIIKIFNKDFFKSLLVNGAYYFSGASIVYYKYINHHWMFIALSALLFVLGNEYFDKWFLKQNIDNE